MGQGEPPSRPRHRERHAGYTILIAAETNSSTTMSPTKFAWEAAFEDDMADFVGLRSSWSIKGEKAGEGRALRIAGFAHPHQTAAAAHQADLRSLVE